MSTRIGNYTAFYVSEPFSPSSLGANATRDFNYYNLLRAWRTADSSFNFTDSHALTYSVRDNSDWETTLKPRLRERIRGSKNLLLILSSYTANSRALREEIDYAMNDQSLPIIVIYPDFDSKASLLSNGNLSSKVKALWDKVPVFRDSINSVPTLHVPMLKDVVKTALNNRSFQFGGAAPSSPHFYPA